MPEREPAVLQEQRAASSAGRLPSDVLSTGKPQSATAVDAEATRGASAAANPVFECLARKLLKAPLRRETGSRAESEARQSL
jgi:hypothetical protein